MDFPTIEEINQILDEIAEEIPTEFFKGLNEGIVLLEEYKMHPESRRSDRLFIMGEYCKNITGRQIKIYYGSFREVYYNTSISYLRKKLKDTLLHEFTHHLESRAGERGLEVKDAEDLTRYRERE